jgi:hypothetical protein
MSEQIIAWFIILIFGVVLSFVIIPKSIIWFSIKSNYGYWNAWKSGHKALLMFCVFYLSIFAVAWSVIKLTGQ